MPDTADLPVSEADAIAFVTSLTAPVPASVIDWKFASLASVARGGGKRVPPEVTTLFDDALGRLSADCTWTVSGGDAAVAQQPPFVDTPKKEAKAADAVIAGYLAGVEALATCPVWVREYVCPEVDPETPPDEEVPDCAETADLVETPTLAIAVAPVGGGLKVRGWIVFDDERGVMP